MPYEMRALDVNFEVGQFVSLAIQNHPNRRDNQAELCQLKKFCLSSEPDYVFRQFTAGNYVL